MNKLIDLNGLRVFKQQILSKTGYAMFVPSNTDIGAPLESEVLRITGFSGNIAVYVDDELLDGNLRIHNGEQLYCILKDGYHTFYKFEYGSAITYSKYTKNNHIVLEGGDAFCEFILCEII